MFLRPATESDRDALYEICRRTGADGQDATELVTDPDLYGDLWVGPYLAHELRYATVAVDDEGVAGYVLGAAHTVAFDAWFADEWLPPLRARYPLPLPPTWTRPMDRNLVEQVHRPRHTPPTLTDQYPSHLHIDILPRLQGKGVGRRLIARLLDQLAADGSPGVHLTASASNTGALAFYRRVGFESFPLAGADAAAFVRSLPAT